MKNLNLKLSKIFAFVTSVFLILALASCSELFSDPERTGSVSFSLSPEVARAVTSSRSLSGYSFDKTTDFSLKDDDDPNTYIFTVSLSGDYSETQYKSYTEAEFDSLGNGKTITSLGNDSTITFNEIPVGSKVKATVTISITDSTGTYPWYEGTSDTKEILEGTNSIDLKITKKQYTCKFNVYIKGASGYGLSSEYSKDLTGDLLAIDEKLVESLESLYETLLQKGYILNEEKIDLWMPKLTGDSTLESSIYFDLPGSSEPGEDEPGTDEPGKEEPGVDEPGVDEPGKDEPAAKTIKICFRFQNGEGEYAANDEIPDITMTFEEADEWSEKISENAVKAVEQGYILNEEKTDKEPVLEGDTYLVNIYFDKVKEESGQTGTVVIKEPKKKVYVKQIEGESEPFYLDSGRFVFSLFDEDGKDIFEDIDWSVESNGYIWKRFVEVTHNGETVQQGINYDSNEVTVSSVFPLSESGWYILTLTVSPLAKTYVNKAGETVEIPDYETVTGTFEIEVTGGNKE